MPSFWLLAAVLLTGAVVFVFSTAFSGFSIFDDEGTLLGWFRLQAAGYRMYDEIYMLYGPFYAGVYGLIYNGLGLPITHSVGRALAGSAWLTYGAGLAALVYRLTRSPAATAVSFVFGMVWLAELMNSPGHPEELCLVLLVAALLLLDRVLRGPSAPALFALGGVLAGLVLVKINIAAFVGPGVIYALLVATEPRGWVRSARPLVLGVSLALPAVLCSMLFEQPWVRLYCLLASASILGVAVLVLAEGTTLSALRRRAWWSLVLGASAVTLIACLGVMATGSSAMAILHAVVLQNAHYVKNWQIAIEITRAGVLSAVASLIVAVGYALAGRAEAWRERRASVALIAKAGFVIVGGEFALLHAWPFGLDTGRQALNLLLPWCWLLVVVPADTSDAMRLFRQATAQLAAAMALYAFPVAGHQVQIATLLPILMVPVLAHDLAPAVAKLVGSLRPSLRNCLPSRIGLVVAAGATVWMLLLGYTTAVQYVRQASLGLPGTTLIRVEPGLAEELQWVTSELARCRASYSLPNQLSFTFWAGQTPLTPVSVNGVLNFIPAAGQETLVERLRQERDLCVLYTPSLLRFFDRGQIASNPPLLRYILTEFAPVASSTRFTIMQRRPGP